MARGRGRGKASRSISVTNQRAVTVAMGKSATPKTTIGKQLATRKGFGHTIKNSYSPKSKI